MNTQKAPEIEIVYCHPCMRIEGIVVGSAAPNCQDCGKTMATLEDGQRIPKVGEYRSLRAKRFPPLMENTRLASRKTVRLTSELSRPSLLAVGEQ